MRIIKSWIKKTVGGLTYILFLIISVGVILEAIFRILPTTSPVDLQPVTSEKDILRFKAEQTAVISLGANFYKTVIKKTNNVGFFSNFDFEFSKFFLAASNAALFPDFSASSNSRCASFNRSACF